MEDNPGSIEPASQAKRHNLYSQNPCKERLGVVGCTYNPGWRQSTRQIPDQSAYPIGDFQESERPCEWHLRNDTKVTLHHPHESTHIYSTTHTHT